MFECCFEGCFEVAMSVVLRLFEGCFEVVSSVALSVVLSFVALSGVSRLFCVRF